jgi:hypothetical protein
MCLTFPHDMPALPPPSHTPPGKAQGGARAGRMGAAEKRSALAGARSAHRGLTCRNCPNGAKRSEFCGTAKTRASQGTRSAAKGKPLEPRMRLTLRVRAGPHR